MIPAEDAHSRPRGKHFGKRAIQRCDGQRLTRRVGGQALAELGYLADHFVTHGERARQRQFSRPVRESDHWWARRCRT